MFCFSGVAQLINKENNAPFTECDVSLFEAFAIFCGLGIHNTQMYENACKLMAKQKVALECLSYHATASNDATEKLLKAAIPSADCYNLYSFTFIDFDLSDDDTCKATIRMFLECNLVQQFHIPYDVRDSLINYIFLKELLLYKYIFIGWMAQLANI